MSFWKLDRNRATEITPAYCETTQVWVPGTGGDGGTNGEFCTVEERTVTETVWQFIPDDPNAESGVIYETSSGGAPTANHDGVPGIWVSVGTRQVTKEVEVCEDTNQQGGGDSGTPGRYVTVENCYPAKTRVYTPTDWNAVCVSTNNLVGSGDYTFTTDKPNGVITGFGEIGVTHTSYRDIRHGVYIYRNGNNQLLRVIELGVFKTSAYVVGSNTVKIARVSGEIQYYIGTTLVHTSDLLSGGTVQVYGYLYTLGDQIREATFVDRVIARLHDDSGVLRPLKGAGAETLDYAAGSLPAITGSGQLDSTAQTSGYLSPLTGYGSDTQNAGSTRGSPQILTGEGYSGTEPVPPLSLTSGGIQPLTGHGYASTSILATGDIITYPLQGFGHDVPDLILSRGRLPPLSGSGIQYDEFSSGNHFSASWAIALSLDSTGTSSTGNTFEGTWLNNATLDSRGGQQGLDETVVLWSLESTGSLVRDAQLNESVVLWSLSSEAELIRTATLDETLTLWSLDSHSGAYLNETLTLWSLDSTGQQVWQARLDETLTLWNLTATADRVRTANLDETVTLWSLDAGDVAVFDNTVVLWSLTATSTPVTTTTTVTNLNNGAVTRYTEGYRNFLRVNGKYFVLGHDDVLSEITGITRNGTTITGKATTYPDEFGTSYGKRVVKGYVDARGAGNLYAGIVADEENRSFPAAINMGTGLQNHPFKPGRGLKGRRLAIELQTEDDATIAGVELQIQPLSRRIR